MSRPFSLTLLALALAFIAYAVVTADTPSRPRPVVTDTSDVEPTLTPPTLDLTATSGAGMVARHLLDARRTP